jgi:predicted nuclease of predicted toxin-antitoxin system
MRVLLDENLPVQLKRELEGHDVRSVAELKWAGIDNGSLLRRMEGNFDVLITADKNIYAQQNLSGKPFSILVVPTNKRRVLLGHAQNIREALAGIRPSTYITMGPDGAVSLRVFSAREDSGSEP